MGRATAAALAFSTGVCWAAHTTAEKTHQALPSKICLLSISCSQFPESKHMIMKLHHEIRSNRWSHFSPRVAGLLHVIPAKTNEVVKSQQSALKFLVLGTSQDRFLGDLSKRQVKSPGNRWSMNRWGYTLRAGICVGCSGPTGDRGWTGEGSALEGRGGSRAHCLHLWVLLLAPSLQFECSLWKKVRGMFSAARRFIPPQSHRIYHDMTHRAWLSPDNTATAILRM